MTLAKCPECGGQVSSTAPACPHCGFKGYTRSKNKSVWSPLHVVSFLSVVMFLLCSGFIYYAATKIEEAREREQRYISSLTPQELAAEERDKQLKSQFDLWNGSHLPMVKLVKNAMNDPKSFEHVNTRYIDMGECIHVFMEYRGKNGFGGVVKESADEYFDLNGKVCPPPRPHAEMPTEKERKPVREKEVPSPTALDPESSPEPEMGKDTVPELREDRNADEAVRLIKRHLIGKDNNQAQEKLNGIMERYPGTTAAAEAAELLRSME